MTIVVIRHGQSRANVDTIFSGWMDTDLTDHGLAEARAGARILKSHHIRFDFADASTLKRAIRTLWAYLEVIDQCHCPYECHWRLNEVHYGRFTGITRDALIAEYGAAEINDRWRRSFDYECPPVPELSQWDPIRHPKYAGIDRSLLPRGESIASMWRRALPIWADKIYPQLSDGKAILVAGHGDMTRAIMKHVEGLSNEEVMRRDVLPNGRAFLYRFDAAMNILESGMLEQSKS
jgi:2,3-bisphosphoglycerate-dependent phosphoglycerate mutase